MKVFLVAALLFLFALILFSITKLPVMLVPKNIDLVQHSRLENEHRQTVAGIWGGVFVLFGGAIALWRAEIARRQVRAIERGNITDRFTRAIEQIGKLNDKDGTPHIVIRLGGIYALEQIVVEAKTEYYWPVLAVLTAYVREAAPADGLPREKPTEDVQVAIAAALRIRRIRPPVGGYMVKPDYSRTYLAGANFSHVDLDTFDFSNSKLSATNFEYSRSYMVNFSNSCLENARFIGAEFEEVHFCQCNIRKANFRNVKIFQSGYSTEDEYVFLPGADFTGTDMTDADLRDCDLSSASGITKAQVVTAIFDTSTTFPNGKKGYTKDSVRSWNSDDCKKAGLSVEEAPLVV